MTALLCALVLPAADPVDWPALVQKPYANLPHQNLQPLWIAADGAPIRTKEEWNKARPSLRAAWMKHLGEPPAQPDSLDMRIEKTEKLPGYTRQLLSFATEGDDRLRAYLLVPDGMKPGEKRPAVVVFHSTSKHTLHEAVGLTEQPERAYGLHLTHRGYITLNPECYILKDPVGWAKGQAAALEKRRPGWTGLGKMTFDASRCIDFLETQPRVDKHRIGCIGFSLGAKEVLYAMAFEPRFQVGVFNEGGIGLRMSNWCDPWYLTGKMKEQVPKYDNHQVLALAAPRPFLLCGGGDADGDAGWSFIQAVLPVYDLYGASDRLGLHHHKGRHSFPREGRRLAYRWLDHWLKFTPVTEEAGPE